MSNNHDNARIGTYPPDGDRNWGGVLLGINWAVFTPALIVVCLRLYSRAWFTHNLGWDDLFMVITEVRRADMHLVPRSARRLTDFGLSYGTLQVWRL